MSKPYVKLAIEKGVGYITFFHPDHNAMPSESLADLEKTILDAGTNKAIKVIVLKSNGNRTFCAGASFKELVSISNEKEGEQFFSGFANVVNAMKTCNKIIVGRVQGKVVGGGVGLAAATDYCLATKNASIKLSELSIGIGPFVIEPVVSKRMGATTMTHMTLNAESFFSAEFAKEKGLYANIFETIEELDDAVKQFAEKLAGYNPEALKALKAVFWEGTDHWRTLLKERAKISGTLVLGDFTKETLRRFQ